VCLGCALGCPVHAQHCGAGGNDAAAGLMQILYFPRFSLRLCIRNVAFDMIVRPASALSYRVREIRVPISACRQPLCNPLARPHKALMVALVIPLRAVKHASKSFSVSTSESSLSLNNVSVCAVFFGSMPARVHVGAT